MTAAELARFLGNVIFGTIRFRRGNEADLPTLRDGEPGWTRDTHKLFIGDSVDGNVEVVSGGGGGGGGSPPSGTGLVRVTGGVYDTPAELSGPITSSGYVTAIAQQTGTGTVFAMQAGPTFTTQIFTPKVVGGTGTTSTLTFQTTTGIGALGADIIFKVGNNGATEGMRIKNDGTVNATTFIGALTGNVTGNVAGNVSGSSGSTTGNAATATSLQTPRTIGGSNFDGTGNVTSFPAPGAIGGTTPAAGTFTTLQTTGNLTVNGDLLVSGDTVTFDTATITVEDPLIKLAKSNAGDAVDAGLYALYTSSGSKYAGLFRDASDGKFKFFTSLEVEPTTTVNTAGTGYTVGTLVATLEGNVTGNVTGVLSGSISGIWTTDGANVTTASAMGALAIDVTKALNTKSIAADSTFTFSGTPATANTWFAVHIINTDTAAHTLTFPSAFSQVTQAARTTCPIAASGQLYLVFRYDGSGYKVFGDGTYINNYTATAAPAVTDDIADGYGPGSLWLNATGNALYICESNSAGAAVWNSTGASGAITSSGLTMATARLLGRTTASTGAIEEITVGTGLSLASGSLTATGGAVQSAIGGRLTTETDVAISTSDRTAQGTIRWTAYNGNQISLYDGSSAWSLVTFSSDITLALTLTSGKNYDVFIYNNSGTATLELSAAWTNDTTRADALTTQNGIVVKSGATTRRYVGTIRASGTNTTEDSKAKRFVWNAYNRVSRKLFVTDTTSTWNYTTDTWRQVRATATNQVEAVIGLVGLGEVELTASSISQNSAGDKMYCGIGEDSTTAPASDALGDMSESTTWKSIKANYRSRPSIGYHYWAWLEKSAAAGTTSWLGQSSGNWTPGLIGSVEC